MLSYVRQAITTNGGTPQSFRLVDAWRELVTAYGGTPTKYDVIGLMREAITAVGGTPTQWSEIPLLRELLTALGVTPSGYYKRALYVQLGTAASGPSMLLSASTVAESASIGDLVGTLSVFNGSGSYTFTITADPDSKFDIDGDDLEVGAGLDFEADATHSVTIEADNGVDDPITRTFDITVTDIPEVLAALTLSAYSFTTSTPSSGTINGATAGSTITADDLPTGLTIDSALRTWDWDGTGSVSTGSLILTETLAGYDNSPHDTSIPYAITAADTTPSQFVWIDVEAATVNTAYESNTITVAGLSTGTSVIVSIVGGEYSKNGGAYTSASGVASNDDTFKVRHTSSADYNTIVNTTLTIGGVADIYSTLTIASPDTPDAPYLTLTGAVDEYPPQVSALLNETVLAGTDYLIVEVQEAGGDWSDLLVDTSTLITGIGTIDVGLSDIVEAMGETEIRAFVNRPSVSTSDASNVIEHGVVYVSLGVPDGYDLILTYGDSLQAGVTYGNNSDPATYDRDVTDVDLAGAYQFTGPDAAFNSITAGIITDDTTPVWGNGPNVGEKLTLSEYLVRAYKGELAANREALVVNMARGGTSLTDGASTASGTIAVGGARYNEAITQFNTALAAAKNEYPGSRIRAIVISAGSNDANSPAGPLNLATFQGAFEAVIDGFRSEVDECSEAPVFIYGPVSGPGGADMTTVRTAITNLAAAMTDVYSFVPADSGSDNLHPSRDALFADGATIAGLIPTTPEPELVAPFTIASASEVALDSDIDSDEFMVRGIGEGVSATLTVTGGETSVNGGGYSSSAKTVNWGDMVSVRVHSSNDEGEQTQGTATVTGPGVGNAESATFTVTTEATGTEYTRMRSTFAPGFILTNDQVRAASGAGFQEIA